MTSVPCECGERASKGTDSPMSIPPSSDAGTRITVCQSPQGQTPQKKLRLQIYISNLKIYICSLRKFGSTVCRGDRHAGHRRRASRPVTGTSLCHRQMARRCSEQLLAHRQFVCRLNDVACKLVHARRLVPVEIYGIHWRLGRIVVDAHPPVKTIDIVMHAVHA